MSNDQKQLNPLDELMARRAQAASELPWLEMRVTAQVEWREQARQWLREHPGGLGDRARQPLRLRIAGAVNSLAAARTWQVGGVALAVACLVWLLSRLDAFAPALQSTAKYGGIYVLGAVLVVLAVALTNWPRLRQYYG
jgi:hypothetical protein